MSAFQFYSLLMVSVSALVTAIASLVAVALGIVTNNKRLDDIRMDLGGRMTRMEGLLAKLGDDYTRFYGEQRRHDEAIETLKKGHQ